MFLRTDFNDLPRFKLGKADRSFSCEPLVLFLPVENRVGAAAIRNWARRKVDWSNSPIRPFPPRQIKKQ